MTHDLSTYPRQQNQARTQLWRVSKERRFSSPAPAAASGKAIGLRAARDGANIVVAAKTTEPHPKLDGTVYTAVKELEAAGGKALACITDIRFEEQVQAAVDKTVETFGGIDILVNNASAISLTGTLDTPMKRFDLMHGINTRGTFLTSKLCLPHLLKAANPHILNISPPLNMEPRWFARPRGLHDGQVRHEHVRAGHGRGVQGSRASPSTRFWPRTVIATAAVQNLLGGDDVIRRARKPEIMADAAHAILTQPSREFTGNFCIDDDVLRQAGVTVDPYAVAAWNCAGLLKR